MSWRVSDLSTAERALYDRTTLACAVARSAGMPGRFRTWERDGLMAVLADDPALGFLSSVSGVTRGTVSAALDLVNEPVWNGSRPAVVVSADSDVVAPALSAAGLVRAEDRLVAVLRLGHGSGEVCPDVVDGDHRFPSVLLTGYGVEGALADFIAAEHRLPAMRRFLVVEHGVPIAAAAMTIHGVVAVLGGASTLPTHRGRGAQTRLLRHRLRVAADAGCALAVATAAAGSVSAANLRAVGFRVHRRSAWV